MEVYICTRQKNKICFKKKKKTNFNFSNVHHLLVLLKMNKTIKGLN